MKISPRGRPFFAHKYQPETCNWQPESPEHIELKAAAHDGVVSVDGWTADIEVSGPDWKADVLAERGKARIAFEIQLSTQGQTETQFRERRYDAADVLPWWIVTSARNAGAGFGSGLRSVITGKDIGALVIATRKEVVRTLTLVENQVRLAESVARCLRSRHVQYEIITSFGLPCAFRLEVMSRGRKIDQHIVLCELGSDAIADIASLREVSPVEPWGTVVQLVRQGKQISGFGAPGIFVTGNVDEEIAERLAPLLDGRLVWRGSRHADHVEAALIWYRDRCSCGKEFARAPFAIAGHLRNWSSFKRRLVPFETDQFEEWAQAVVQNFEKREGLKLGKIQPQAYNDARWPSAQKCPSCWHEHRDSLITADEALERWPFRTIDWTQSKRPEKGHWIKPGKPSSRAIPPESDWLELVVSARQRREKAAAQERAQCAKRERDAAEMREKMRVAQAEAKAKAEQERVLREQERREAVERRRVEEMERLAAQRAEREASLRAQLLSTAVNKFGRRDRAELWMRSTHPRLGRSPHDACVIDFERCLSLLRPRGR